MSESEVAFVRQVVHKALWPRRLHRWMGWCLIVPFWIWSMTGLVFFMKPGYQAAFAPLSIKTYPMTQERQVEIQPQWQEVRWLQTVLGPHLLVNISGEWQQRALEDLSVRHRPNDAQLLLLIQDAIDVDPQRYGQQVYLTPQGFETETGVRIQLDWENLRLSQQGYDTRLINALYKAHYLQWTGQKQLDQWLGVMGLLLLMGSTIVGVYLLLRRG
jgi:hypothetical protein